MIVERNFKIIIPDNDEKYFSLLEGVISSVDEFSNLLITRGNTEYHFRIVPSDPMYINSLIERLVALHKILRIKLNFSKSIKNSASISYSLSIFEKNK